jgi:alkylation response protein AidB-like acyl-CoA dehydrogenase
LDLAAVLAGCLRRAWRQARDHAETRPMFKRHLADFEDIRYRLIRLSAALSDAEALAGDANGRSLAALTALADEARDELQQIAGGTGYMADSAFAESVWWLDWLDRALRAGPGIFIGAG